MKYDVFISYSRKDIEFAREVCAVLDSYKQYYTFEYFFDQSDITSANEYLDRISSAIYDSKAVLFIASKNAYASKFCAKELLFADDEGKNIHQYRIDEASMPHKIKMLLGMHQYRELKSTPIENEVREVLKDVLGCNILSLEELKAKETQHKSDDHDVQPNRNRDWLKRPAVWLSTVAILVVALLEGLVLSSDSKEIYEVVVEESEVNNMEEESKDDLLEAEELVVEETKYSVGDFYDDSTRQGVVFDVSEDGLHGKIVSLKDALHHWCTDEQLYEEIRVGANSDRDGKINTDIVMQGGDYANYPAFMWCRKQGKEWYLPSKEELMAIYDVKDLVNKTLAQYSYREITNDWHWSSTEQDEFCAWYVLMFNGDTYDGNKINRNYVRAVSAF